MRAADEKLVINELGPNLEDLTIIATMMEIIWHYFIGLKLCMYMYSPLDASADGDVLQWAAWRTLL